MPESGTWIGGVRDIGRAKDGSQLAVALIYDEDADKVVGARVVAGREDVAFGDFFREVCAAPEWGEPRVPTTLVVDDEAYAREVAALGLGVAIAHDESGVVEELIEEFLEAMAGDSQRQAPRTSLVGEPWSPAPRQGKRLEPLGARILAAAPWRRIDEATPIRLSAPRHGFEGVVGVFGALGQSPGFSIYRSARDLRAFVRAAARSDRDRPSPLEAPLVTLTMTPRKRGLPETTALHVTETWTSFEADKNELALVVAVAEALLRLGRADRVSHEGVTLSLEGASVVPLRQVGERRASAGPPARLPDRNDPCWCGSGKKYKKCHLDVDAGDTREARGEAGPAPGRSR